MFLASGDCRPAHMGDDITKSTDHQMGKRAHREEAGFKETAELASYRALKMSADITVFCHMPPFHAAGTADDASRRFSAAMLPRQTHAPPEIVPNDRYSADAQRRNTQA